MIFTIKQQCFNSALTYTACYVQRALDPSACNTDQNFEVIQWTAGGDDKIDSTAIKAHYATAVVPIPTAAAAPTLPIPTAQRAGPTATWTQDPHSATTSSKTSKSVHGASSAASESVAMKPTELTQGTGSASQSARAFSQTSVEPENQGRILLLTRLCLSFH